MPRIKKLSGPALHRSWLNIPHVTHNEEADITDLDHYRKELDTAAKAEGYRVTLLSFVIKASVSALKQHWEVNSSVHPDGDKLIEQDHHNIGFAADTPGGLMVPVIKDADRKGCANIVRRHLVAEGARGHAERAGYVGGDLYHLIFGRDWRHVLYPHRERARGGHSRPDPLEK